MTPIKILFTLNSSINERDDTGAAKMINGIVRSAFENKNKLEGNPYARHASNVIHNRNIDIQKCLVDDNNTWFSFEKADFEPFEIVPDRMSGGYSLNYTWQMQYTLYSVEYICLEILNDRTIVCHKTGESKIEFIPINSFKLILVQ